MKIENMTNVEIRLTYPLNVPGRFSLHWDDAATNERWHIWFAGLEDLHTQPADLIYKNPPLATRTFRTRKLDPTAACNREIVAYAQQIAIVEDLHAKAVAAVAAEKAKATAVRAEVDRILRIKDHGPELLAALADAHDRLVGFIGTDCECDNTHEANNTTCCLCQYNAVIAAATEVD